MHDDIKYWVWLSSLIKISPLKKFKLIEYFKDPALIWHSTEDELKKLPFMSGNIIDALLDKQKRIDTDIHLEKIQSEYIEVITFNNDYYPEFLKNIHDPPVAIYVKGKLIKNETSIAVVGSRNATLYGLDMAESLSYSLSQNGMTIASGMARGVDSRAHIGALKAGGRTIAVLGCGLDIVYPSENKELMKKICDNGAVISEFLPGVPPIPLNFPARNRIISGISKGVVIIEANEKSGSLITANYALEQGRDVFALPGNVNCSNSIGTNRLIRDGAKIVIDVTDILDELNLLDGANNRSYRENKRSLIADFDNEEKTIAEKLMEGPMHIDTIARDCGLSIQLVGSVLVMLELSGFVQQLPGKFYRLVE